MSAFLGSHPLRRPVCLLLAFFFLAIFALVLWEASRHASPLWISWICYLTAFAIMLRLVLVRDDVALKTQLLPWHLCRAIFGFGATFLYMLALRYIPLTDAMLLLNISPLLLAPLIACGCYPSLLKKMVVPLCSGIAAIAFIIKPTDTLFEEVGDWLALASGICLTLAFACLRRVAAVDTAACINVHFFGIVTLLQTPFLFLFGVLPTAHEIGLAIIAGMAMSIAQWLLVTACKDGEMARLAPLQYSMLVFVAILDVIMGGESLSFDSTMAVSILAISAFMVSRIIPEPELSLSPVASALEESEDPPGY